MMHYSGGAAAGKGAPPPLPPSDMWLSEDDYLHDEISRADAEKAIQAAGSYDGTFLVRKKGDIFALSIFGGNKIEHHTCVFGAPALCQLPCAAWLLPIYSFPLTAHACVRARAARPAWESIAARECSK